MIDEKKVKENLKKTLTQQEQILISITSINTALIYKGIITKEESDEFFRISTDGFIDKKYESISDKQKEILSSDIGTQLWEIAQSALGGIL